MNKAMIYDGRKLKVAEYDTDSYEFVKRNVGGYLEHVPLRELDSRNIDMWIDEEGKLKNKSTTIMLTSQNKIYDYIVGTVVFTKVDDEGNTISLTDEDVEFIKYKFDNDGFYIDFKSGKLIQSLSYQTHIESGEE